MSQSAKPPQPQRTAVSGLVLVVIILAALVGLFGGALVSNYETSAYFTAHPQVSTVISSATVSQTQTETDTSYSTLTQMSVSTSTQNQNGNFYNNYPNYPYPNYQYQCQYPYYSQCYPTNPGGQEQRIFGQIYGQGACIYLQSYQSYQYGPVYALYNVPSNYVAGSYVYVYGYLTNNYNQCAGGTGFWVISMVSQ